LLPYIPLSHTDSCHMTANILDIDTKLKTDALLRYFDSKKQF